MANYGQMALCRDIWVLIAEQLALGSDHGTLARLGRRSHELAHVALPFLYGGFELGDHEPDDPRSLTLRQTITYWGSIVGSTTGNTGYPYYAFVRSINLANLDSVVDLMRSNPALRAGFLPRSLDAHCFGVGSHPIDVQAAVSRMVALLADALKTGAKRPSARIPALRSLTFPEQVVLPHDFGKVIRDTCPKFNQLYAPPPRMCTKPPLTHGTGRRRTGGGRPARTRLRHLSKPWLRILLVGTPGLSPGRPRAYRCRSVVQVGSPGTRRSRRHSHQCSGQPQPVTLPLAAGGFAPRGLHVAAIPHRPHQPGLVASGL